MPASRQHYEPPPWRTAVSAAAYVDERLHDANSGLSTAIAAIKDAKGDPVFAKLFDIKLVSVVETARGLHRVLSRAKTSHAKALEAAKAYKVLVKWILSTRVSGEELKVLTRIGTIIDIIIDATSPPRVRLRFGATRETGSGQKDQEDRRAAQFAIGELAYFVRKASGEPHTALLATVASDLFDPGMDLFPDGLGTENIEDYRDAHRKIAEARAKLTRGLPPIIHWSTGLQ
jgi:hypothetical protein